MRLADFPHRHIIAVHVAHRLIAKMRSRLVVRDNRHFNLLQIGEIADLDFEVP